MRLPFPVGIVVITVLLTDGPQPSSGTDSLGKNTNVVIRLPLVATALLCSASQAAKVWIPEQPPKPENEASVQNEYAEVATVFGKPDSKVVQEPEVIPNEQPVQWTSLKTEWDLYKKFHENKKRRATTSTEDSEEAEDDESRSEEDELENRRHDKLPIAFYGQQNEDDDEKDHAHQAKELSRRVDKKVEKGSEESDEEEEEDEEEVKDDEPNPANDAVAQSAMVQGIQTLDNLTEDEKQAIIDRIFAEAISAGKTVNPAPTSAPVVTPPKTEENSDETQSDEEDSSESDVNEAPKKGDGADLQDDGGKGKGKKKKKKKGKKKSGHGWGWKQPIYVPVYHADKGWKKHDGILEQMVKGSTWERVLQYYHHRKDENEGQGWGEGQKLDIPATLHATGEHLTDKLFKGSFWDRAFKTYSNYKNNKQKSSKPAKEIGGDSPLLEIDWKRK